MKGKLINKNLEEKSLEELSLEELKEIVSGYIEIIHLTNNKIMVINDEGKLINLPHNENATILFRLCLDTIDFIVGNVLVCNTNRIR